MSKELIRLERPVFDDPHPLVYGGIAGLLLWFALSAWAFFSDAGYDAFALVVVSGLLLIAVVLPYLLWRTGRKSSDWAPAGDERSSLRGWLSGDFRFGTGQRSALIATIEILLPIMAVAFGITALGIIFLLAASNAAAV